MLFRKAPTNYALELTIDKLFDRFKSMKNRIKAVEKAIKNGWINIGGETKRECRRMQKEHRANLCATNWDKILPDESSQTDWSAML